MPASSRAPEHRTAPWRLRARTVQAAALLCGARALVRFVPFRLWRGSLGLAADGAGVSGEEERRDARRLAVRVHRAASRLPGTKCLPQMMALSVLLRRARIPHALVIAARPARFAGSGERLHAWIEQGGERILGDLPGPWIETLRLERPAA